MSDEYSDIERLAPQKLLEGFSKGKVFMCVVTAVVLHVVIIGGFSTSYIYYKWINPEAGRLLEEQKKKAAAEAAAGQTPAAPKKAAEAAGTNKVAAAAKEASGDGGKEGESQKELLEKHKDAPVVKEITEKADPSEIPAEPGGCLEGENRAGEITGPGVYVVRIQAGDFTAKNKVLRIR